MLAAFSSSFGSMIRSSTAFADLRVPQARRTRRLRTIA
jgi:hypothetical protein